MREGELGNSSGEGRREFPKDVKIYRRCGTWVLYLSKETGELMVDTTDYHPGLLYVTREDLEGIVKELSK